ncbi:ABC transporter substrate-binding protein [Nesterenkonia sp. MY13]|uniref:ABC transporter substrate-binding protein n=1 Tax=Nesterenkonia sedimenti TaxID=1463632 RepID=A0A7X8TK70_9MICC|nr:ABC transporter substrate-binding protein [Nesterenkonia sedimenti]NLS10310.1 ABC transporter substrate-binding protein [Nesterenkonia sedimenti]
MTKEVKYPRILKFTAASATAAFLLTACQDVQTGQDSGNGNGEASQEDRETVTSHPIDGRATQDGGHLIVGLSAEPDLLDPTLSSSLHMRHLVQPICEKLYDIDEAGEVYPVLATDLPEVSEDELTVTIPVRTGIQFSDGTEFDAEAVATSIDRHLNLAGSSRTSELGPLEEITAVDEETVELTFSEPFAPIDSILADRAGMIMSPDRLEELGENFADDPSCVGPFRFVERTQNAVQYEADPNYYDADEIHLDSIEYRFITDSSIAEANLNSGDIHVADSLSPLDMDELVESENLTMLRVPSYGYQGITLNLANEDGAGTDPVEQDTELAQHTEVRQALSMAINRQALVDSVFDGWFDPACSPISPDTPFSTDASEACPEYDPEGAQQLLEDAGVETPVEITLNVGNNPEAQRLAQAIQAQVEEAGFSISINPLENAALLESQNEGDFEAIQIGWSGRVDPHGNTFNFLSTGGGNNYSNYSDEQVDELLNEATTVIDEQERAQMYGEVVETIHEDVPIIYTHRIRNLTGMVNEVAGIEQYPDGVLRVSHAAFLDED